MTNAKNPTEFEQPDTSIASVTSIRNTPTVPAAVPTMAVATAQQPAVQGMFTSLPCSRVKIAYSVSKNLPEEATEGSLVLRISDDTWVKIAAPTRPVTVLILAARMYYKEWLTGEAFTAGRSPKSYATKEEAIADGQTTEWTANGDRPSVSPALDVTMLLERPADFDSTGEDPFILALDNKLWAPCIMTIDKSNAKKAIESMSRLILRDIAVNGVPRDKASLSAFFCTLTINAVLSPTTGRKARVPSFAVALDKDHKTMSPSPLFKEQLSALVKAFSDPTSTMGDEDDLPY